MISATARARFTYTRTLRASGLFFNLRVTYSRFTRNIRAICAVKIFKTRALGFPWWCCAAVPFGTPFPTSYFTSSLPFCLCARLFWSSFWVIYPSRGMGVVTILLVSRLRLLFSSWLQLCGGSHFRAMEVSLKRKTGLGFQSSLEVCVDAD